MTRRRPARRVLAAVLAAGLCVTAAACTGGTDDQESVSPTAEETAMNPTVPTGAALGLAPASPDGTATEVLPGIVVTVPEGAILDEDAPAEGSAEAVTYRMPGAVDGVPVLQVASSGVTSDSVVDETWVQEAAMTANPDVVKVHRSLETWPGADEAVALGWQQSVASEDGSPLEIEVLTLWLRTPEGRSAKLTAIAPVGELEGSSAYEALLSVQLVERQGA